MKFKTATREGIFLKRYKRFFADVEIGGQVVVAHVPNTGSMKSAAEPGSACLVTESDNPERKLKFTLEAVRNSSGSWVGVNTSWPNHLAAEAFHSRIFSHWHEFDQLKSEVKLSPETRIDLVLSDSRNSRQHFVEVKNVTMASGPLGERKGVAHFPDAVTTRGQKHLRELIRLVSEGHSAEIFFAVQRDDCLEFSVADAIDPDYGKLLRAAIEAGVRATAAHVQITPQEIFISGRVLDIKL